MQLGSQALVAGLCARLTGTRFVAVTTTSGAMSEALQTLLSRRRLLHRAALRRASCWWVRLPPRPRSSRS
jgi:hypothetical protein